MTSTSEFLSNVIIKSGGYYRPNRFSAEFTPPSSLQLDTPTLQRVSMNCSAATIPGLVFAMKDNNPGGTINRQIPHTPLFQDWPVIFYLSDDHMEKRFFNAWQRLAFDETWGSLEYYENYVGSATINLETKREGGPNEIISLDEVFPKVVGDVFLSYESGNVIAKLPVVLSYHIWYPKERSSGKF